MMAGCASQPMPTSGPPTRPQAEVAEVWEYPASAFPTACMILRSDGTLQFRGGFLIFNGGSWTRDPESSLTSIVLGGTEPVHIDAVDKTGGGKSATPLAFDERTRTLRYRITPATESIQFAGFVFYRKARCSAP